MITECNNNFREYDQSQLYLATLNLKKTLDESHPAKIINDVVEILDLRNIYNTYSEEGNPPYHPKMMLKILFYGYVTGTISCRKMYDAVQYRADFMYLAGGQVPDFRTINRFRQIHIKQLPNIFSQIVKLCVRLDMVSFEYLAIDGETIKANASFQKNKSRNDLSKQIKDLEEKMEKILSREIPETETEEVKKWLKDRNEKINIKKERLLEAKKELDEIIEADKKNVRDRTAC